MKITKTYLKQIIKEELNYLLENKDEVLDKQNADKVLNKLRNEDENIGIYTAIPRILNNYEEMIDPIIRHNVLSRYKEIIDIYKEKMKSKADKEYIESSSKNLEKRLNDMKAVNTAEYTFALQDRIQNQKQQY